MVQVTQCGWVDPIVGDVQIAGGQARCREELGLHEIHVPSAVVQGEQFDWAGQTPLARVLPVTDQDGVRSRRRLVGLQVFQK